MTRRETMMLAAAVPVELGVTSSTVATPDGFEVTYKFTGYYYLRMSPGVVRMHNVDPEDIQEP